MDIVVGSGPAGVSAAVSLLAKGKRVTMLDVGYSLESVRQTAANNLAQSSVETWGEDAMRPFKEAVDPDIKGLPKKLIFGSDYPFRSPASALEIAAKNVDVLISHGKGGLSAVWGANLLPLLESDVQDWPLPLSDLTPYYTKVLDYVDISARSDALEAIFPIIKSRPSALTPSKQATALLSDLDANRESLLEQSIHHGASRLAVRSTPSNADRGCIYCGLCLYGCPFGLIYNSASTLEKLLANKNFSYVSNAFVERIVETASSVITHTHNLATGVQEQIRADRVFVGAGAVASTRIMMESADLYDKEIVIRDSQYFLIPLLRFSGAGNVTNERLHTLSQVAINIRSQLISSKSVHILAYTYNDLYSRAIAKLSGRLFPLLKPLAGALLSRLIVLQGYLHSEDSASIAFKVSRPHAGKRMIELEGRTNPRTKSAMKNLIKLLKQQRRSLRGLLLTPLMHIGAAGKSYHVGASLPMSRTPGQYDSDLLGRPFGFSRVHVIDTAIFPDVPATNVTFSIMANAYRIADIAE